MTKIPISISANSKFCPCFNERRSGYVMLILLGNPFYKKCKHSLILFCDIYSVNKNKDGCFAQINKWLDVTK